MHYTIIIIVTLLTVCPAKADQFVDFVNAQQVALTEQTANSYAVDYDYSIRHTVNDTHIGFLANAMFVGLVHSYLSISDKVDSSLTSGLIYDEVVPRTCQQLWNVERMIQLTTGYEITFTRCVVPTVVPETLAPFYPAAAALGNRVYQFYEFYMSSCHSVFVNMTNAATFEVMSYLLALASIVFIFSPAIKGVCYETTMLVVNTVLNFWWREAVRAYRIIRAVPDCDFATRELLDAAYVDPNGAINRTVVVEGRALVYKPVFVAKIVDHVNANLVITDNGPATVMTVNKKILEYMNLAKLRKSHREANRLVALQQLMQKSNSELVAEAIGAQALRLEPERARPAPPPPAKK
jgi:hypothetical protein